MQSDSMERLVQGGFKLGEIMVIGAGNIGRGPSFVSMEKKGPELLVEDTPPRFLANALVINTKQHKKRSSQTEAYHKKGLRRLRYAVRGRIFTR